MAGTEGEAHQPPALRARLLGCEVRRLRSEHGLTLTRLAKAARLSASYLSEIEQGKKTPSLAALDRLAPALGVTRDTLVPPSSARLDAPGFPARLRAARERAGLTQGQLAETAGVSTSLIGQLESSATQPSLATVERLAQALRVSPCHLLVDDPDLERVIADLGPAVRAALSDPLLQALLRTAAQLDQAGLRELVGTASALAGRNPPTGPRPRAR